MNEHFLTENGESRLSNTFSALLQKADLFSLLLASSNDCIKLVGLDGTLEDMNCGGLNIMEIEDFPAVRGRAWDSLWPAASRNFVIEALARARAGETSRFQAFCPTGRGTPKWWDVTVTPVRGEHDDIIKILTVSRDITAERDLEETLRSSVAERDAQLAEMARELTDETTRLAVLRRQLSHSEKVRLLGDLVGHIVHDMNNVLAVLTSSFRMIRREAKDVAPAALFAHGEEAIERGASMVRQLLDFASGGGDEPEVLQVDKTFESWLGMLQHLVGRDIKVEMIFPADLPAITTRVSALQSVIFNLAANARDAMPKGGTLTLGVLRAPGANGLERLQLIVRDTGQGMPSDVLARAGEPFFSTKGVGKGTGLGLASAFEFARAHGGSVDISSVVGAGTTISILMPVAPVRGEIVASSGDKIDPALHGAATILVVEEEAVLRAFVASMLRGLGYSVIEAHSPGMALGLALSLDTLDLLAGRATQALDALAAQIREKTGRRLPQLAWAAREAEGAGETILRLPLSETEFATRVLIELGRLPGQRMSSAFVAPSEAVVKPLILPAARAALAEWLDFMARNRCLPTLASLACWGTSSENRVRVAVKALVPQSVFRYLDVGSALEAPLGETITGKLVTGSADHGFGSLETAYRECGAGAPFIEDACYTLSGGQYRRFQRLVLPFSEDGQRVTHLLGFAHFMDAPTRA